VTHICVHRHAKKRAQIYTHVRAQTHLNRTHGCDAYTYVHRHAEKRASLPGQTCCAVRQGTAGAARDRAGACVCLCQYTRTYIHAYIHTYIQTYVHTCKHTYIYTHTHAVICTGNCCADLQHWHA